MYNSDVKEYLPETVPCCGLPVTNKALPHGHACVGDLPPGRGYVDGYEKISGDVTRLLSIHCQVHFRIN